MSDRGTPDGFRHMNGYSSHTFKWINKDGEIHWVKLHFKTKSGIKNMTSDQAAQLYTDPDYATRDLVSCIDQGKTAEGPYRYRPQLQGAPGRLQFPAAPDGQGGSGSAS